MCLWSTLKGKGQHSSAVYLPAGLNFTDNFTVNSFDTSGVSVCMFVCVILAVNYLSYVMVWSNCQFLKNKAREHQQKPGGAAPFYKNNPKKKLYIYTNFFWIQTWIKCKNFSFLYKTTVKRPSQISI